MEMKINVDMTALKTRIGLNIKRVEATLASLRDQYEAILQFEASQQQKDLFEDPKKGETGKSKPVSPSTLTIK